MGVVHRSLVHAILAIPNQTLGAEIPVSALTQFQLVESRR
jgi:hypothetical protein